MNSPSTKSRPESCLSNSIVALVGVGSLGIFLLLIVFKATFEVLKSVVFTTIASLFNWYPSGALVSTNLYSVFSRPSIKASPFASVVTDLTVSLVDVRITLKLAPAKAALVSLSTFLILTE